MDFDKDFDALFEQVIDEELEDNTDEYLMRIALEMQQQSDNTTRRRKKRLMIDRCREEGHNRLFNDYFSENSIYTYAQFRRRFRMQRHVSLRIVEALGHYDDYFQMRVDATRKKGLSPLQKCTTAIHILAYGSSADSTDDYIRIGESTAVECLERFVSGVCNIFRAEYLRRPNNEDVERLLQMGNARSFPGNFCQGDHSKPTIMLEAVASQDLWIWHAFFGTIGSNNDINMLNASNVFNDVLLGQAPAVQYIVNRTQYNMGYYLADGIYPEWATFLKTIPMPQGEKMKLFVKQQESARKDVERAFGVLQSRFAIVRGPTRAWRVDTLKNIMHACIILHNMIVEDERHTYNINFDYDNSSNEVLTSDVSIGPHPIFTTTYLQRRAHLHDRQQHRQLQHDLVEHIWGRFGHHNNEN
ncbi:uncharacterized protein LOC109812481 [Cajanus cajan]|uniref:uncharacterized protein LOC109812481 n=1 Tax=Cajanus cajan TaxID=3821 RepID=UPI00098DBC13|nr:uncharacterized protein LOC109812481 [Cajanus cajan]